MIYIALVGRPGTNKSHPLSFFLEPMKKQDTQDYKYFEDKRKQYEYAIGLSKKERETEGISIPEEPLLKKMLVNDITPEALASVHQNNPDGLGVYVDELAGWLKSFNRYNSGGEQEFWLSCFSGKPINIDRKTSKPIKIDEPFVSVAGTIQTGVLTEFTKQNRSSNGFFERILFAYPEALKKEVWNEEELPEHIPGEWESVISKIFNIEGEQEYLFTDAATNKLRAWQADNVKLCNNADTEGLEGIYSKLEIYAIRFSLILEVLSSRGSGNQIKDESVEGAIKLVEYFRGSALKVYGILNDSTAVDYLPKNKRLFYEELPKNQIYTAEVVEKGKKHDLSERTVKRLLNDTDLFDKVKHGQYVKKL